MRGYCSKKAKKPNEVGTALGPYWGTMHIYPDGTVNFNKAALRKLKLAMRKEPEVEVGEIEVDQKKGE